MESDAIADAKARARNETCREFFRGHNGDFDVVDRVSTAVFVRGDPHGRCTSTSPAYVGRGDVFNRIYTCDPFYGGSASLRADAVLHEMLHLAGKSHGDLGGPGPFHQAVMASCP